MKEVALYVVLGLAIVVILYCAYRASSKPTDDNVGAFGGAACGAGGGEELVSRLLARQARRRARSARRS